MTLTETLSRENKTTATQFQQRETQSSTPSYDTSILKGKFSSLNSQLENIRKDISQSSQRPQTSSSGNFSKEEQQALKNLNAQTAGDKFTGSIQQSKSKDFLESVKDGYEKQLKDVAGQLGMGSNIDSSPPVSDTSSKGSETQQPQPAGSKAETSQAPTPTQQPNSDNANPEGKRFEVDEDTLAKAMNSMPGQDGQHNGVFFSVDKPNDNADPVGQIGGDCGACAYLNATGKNSSQSDVAATKQQMVPGNPSGGVYPDQMAKFLNQKPQYGVANLKNELANGKNAIVGVNPEAYKGDAGGKSSHWISVEGYNPETKKFIVEDSLGDPKKPSSSQNPQDPNYSQKHELETTDKPGPITGEDESEKQKPLDTPNLKTTDLDPRAKKKGEQQQRTEN